MADLSPMLAGALRRASASVDQRLSRAMAPHGVSAAEFAVLSALYDAGAVPPSVLAARIGLTRGAVTRSVDRLRGKGLVVRAAGAGDARYRTIALTGAGARLTPVLVDAVAAYEADMIGALSPAAMTELMAALHALSVR